MRGLVVLAVLGGCANPTPPPVPTAVAPAAHVLGIEASDVDHHADPCTDFYAYANGAWRAANPIPQGQTKWGRRAAARDKNRRQLRELLAEVAARTDRPAGSSEQLAGDLFASCVDEAAVEAAGLTPIAPLLADLRKIETAGDLQHAIRQLHALNITAPFGVTGAFDNAEPTRYLANVVPAGFAAPDRARVAKLLVLAGANEAAAHAAADKIFALETKLAAASLDPKSAADPVLTEHLMTVAQLAALAPRIDWAGYLADAKLPGDALNVTEPKFLAELNKQLAETPLATWKLYLEWHLLDTAAPWLTKAFADGDVPPRAERCTELTETLVPDAVGQLYVARYFPPAAKAKARAMADALVAAIEAEIPHVAWMSPETKQRALAKISESRVELGYPDHWKSYAGVTIRRDALWANIAQARAFAVADDRGQVGKPTDRRSWRLPPSSPLAYIDLQINELVLPAGFLQAPVFDPAASDAVNLGAFGSGLAHDLLHAIDATGEIYAVDGKPLKWWTPSDEAGFREHAACVRDEYAAYTVEPGLHVDGARVLDEAVGDLSGLHVAFVVLQHEMAQHSQPAIDGFTPAQQFFVAWGQLRGEAIGPDAERQMLKTDIHPVPRLRVNGPLPNLPEFAATFACKATPQPCAIW